VLVAPTTWRNSLSIADWLTIKSGVRCAAGFQSGLRRVMVKSPNASSALLCLLSPGADMPPQKLTAVECQVRTHAPQQKDSLVDYLVSEREQIVGDFDANRLGGL
jgi:hypothetical protein